MSFMDNHIQKPWAVTHSEVLTETNTSESGLSEDAVRIRQKDGLNELAAKPPKTTLQIIKEQIIDPMIMILLGAAFFSALFHEYTEAIIIAMIVVINTIIGIFVCILVFIIGAMYQKPLLPQYSKGNSILVSW
ncbi:Calcium-transporting ATPase 1 [Lactobacillus helveticus]|nr:Calcium-transporting ATPase 1 [Lactobacillus helveticus]